MKTETTNAVVQAQAATQIEEIEKATIPLVNEIEQYKCLTSFHYEQGQKYLKILGDLEKLRKGREALALVPAKAAVEAIRDIYRPAQEKLSDAVATVKDKMGAYRIAEEQRAEEERKRILSDGRTKAETKEDKLSAVTAAPTKGTRKVPKVRVISTGAIPLQFFDLNESRLKAWLLEGNICKGAEIYYEKIIVS